MHLPIRARLTLTFAVLMALVLTLVGIFIYVRLSSNLLTAIDVGLASRAESLVGVVEAGDSLTSVGQVIDPDEAFAQVMNRDGEVVDSSSGISRAPLLPTETVAAVGKPSIFEADVRTDEEQITARLLAVPSANDQVVVVGASLEDHNDALHGLAVLSTTGGAGALALATLAGWIVAGAALRPVERMRAEADTLSASDPGQRLAVPGTGDELARLGTTLNRLLERIETSRANERTFISSASHELRTPLANLKAELQLAQSGPADAQALRAALDSAATETDRLILLAQDLLLLAGSDEGDIQLRRETVDVSALVEAEIVRFSARAESLGITMILDIPPGLAFSVDPSRFRQVLVNLLDNAIRHTPSGGTVTVSGGLEGHLLSIAVADSGSGFPDDLLMTAFDAFTRADSGRARADGGAGLGLSIVRALVEAHGGSVEARNSTHGGAVIRFQLPA